ncbi:MAG: RNA 2',3'-cyclic phosphodiesterase [Armatimonadetes bacterium]|nr:RNA 2',3'-cyclic phosphodiesterase [Armatimonadota bacterium]
MEKIRTFIAVLLPAEVRSRLAEVKKQLIATKADVKWVSEENFHITLKFLGSIDAAKLDAVTDAVREAVESMNRFEIFLEGAGAFPRPSSPRVIWVGVKTGKDQLKEIARRVDTALEKLGFPREDRPFTGHVTLGRARSSQGVAPLRESIDKLRDESIGTVMVDSVAVMRSDLHPTGPIYTALRKVELVA